MITVSFDELVERFGVQPALAQLELERESELDDIARLLAMATGRSAVAIVLFNRGLYHIIGGHQIGKNPRIFGFPEGTSVGKIYEYETPVKHLPLADAVENDPIQTFAFTHLDLNGESIGAVAAYAREKLPELTLHQSILLKDIAELCSNLVQKRARLRTLAYNLRSA